MPTKQQNDESSKESITPDFLRGIEPISPEEEKGMEDRAYSGAADDIAQNAGLSSDELADAESSGATPAASDADKSEQAATGGEAGNFPFRNEGQKRFRVTKKQGIIGGIVGLLVGGSFGILSILQGPMMIVHASQLLSRFHFSNDSAFMDGRAGKIIKHIRTASSPERRNLSYIGNIGADHFDTKLRSAGIDMNYSQDFGTRGRLQSLDIDPGTPEGQRALRQLSADGVTLDPPDPTTGKVRVSAEGLGQGKVKGVVSVITRSAELDGVAGLMSRRLLKQRSGYINMFHPFRKAAARGDEAFARWLRDYRAERKKTLETGSEKLRPDLDSPEGEDPNDSKAKADAGEIADQAIKEAEEGLPIKEVKANFKTRLGKVAGVAGFGALLCGLDKLGDSVPQLKHQNMVLPMIRLGMSVVTMGSQVMAGGNTFSMDELRAISGDLYKSAEEADGADDPFSDTSFFSDASIQAESGSEITGIDSMKNRKPNTGKPLFFEIVSDLIGAIPGGGTICGGLTSTIGGWIADTVDIGLGIATGGGSAFLAAGGIAAGYAGSALFIDDIVGWIIGAPVNVLAQGSELGGLANFGVALGARDSCASHGCLDLSDEDSGALDMDRFEREKAELQSKPLLARYFDIKDSQSLASRFVFENKTVASMSNPRNLLSGLSSSIGNLNFASALISAFSPRVSASSKYDYGFKEKGFTLEEINNPDYDNPFEIAEWVEGTNPATGNSRLAELNEKYGIPCFRMSVDPYSGKLVAGNDVLPVEDPPIQCVRPSDPKQTNPEFIEFTKYRFYLADLTTARSMACYEGLDEESCIELGIGATTSASDLSGGIGLSPDGMAFPLKTTKNTLINNPARWCYQSQTNCHHDYNAADIFAPTGTYVVAARGGIIVSAKDNDGSKVGSRVVIKGEDGNLYYYAHMGDGTIRVKSGESVTAGQQIGQVGTRADAVGTDPHLHFDALPPGFKSRPSCSGITCVVYPFINVQPVLVSAFQGLPE